MTERKKLVPKRRFKEFQSADAWEQRKLGDCFDERQDRSADGELISVTISSGIKKFSELGRHDNSSDDKSNYKKVEIGDLAYNSMRMWQGASGYSPYNGILSPAYTVIIPKEGVNSLFFSYMFKRDEMIYKFQIHSQGITSDTWNLKFPELSKIDCRLPGVEEQMQIAEYFTALDNLITLQQRKLDKTKDLKKAMLDKMFPKEGSYVPEMRFPGFTDAWEQRKFSEIFVFLQNNSLSRADLNYEKGLIKNVHYGDILIKFGEILDVKHEVLPYISNEAFPISITSLLQNGDVIISDAAEDETVGKCSEIRGIYDMDVVSGLHTIPSRPLVEFAPGYLGYYLNSNAFHDQLLPLIQGTKISSISKSALRNTTINYPNKVEEQIQIGHFFQNLDNLITLQQRKLEKLHNFKKAMLEEMFV